MSSFLRHVSPFGAGSLSTILLSLETCASASPPPASALQLFPNRRHQGEICNGFGKYCLCDPLRLQILAAK